MAGLLAIFAEFERQVLRERTRAGLAHARENGKRLGRPETAARHAAEIRKLRRAGISKSEIARRLQIGRTSGASHSGSKIMRRPKRDAVREDRIHNEAIVDARPEEQVPLSQLEAIDADEPTQEAIGDWHYWVAQGCIL
jgi:hypothetical protein